MIQPISLYPTDAKNPSRFSNYPIEVKNPSRFSTFCFSISFSLLMDCISISSSESKKVSNRY
jgi:hypothetical protein